ncbi:phiSA1p31-related protein [Streptomyces sp. NPDC033538]|uniref:phiSA1p31-related protein n=1 Tax=Streptomyces sp. NPDC033538 TaxID=3155367 RepID=UPI0033EE74A4
MAFKVGDKVTHRSFGEGEIDFGPFEHYTGPDHYLMRDGDGKHVLVDGGSMKPIAKFEVGDKVRGTFTGRVYIIAGGPFFSPEEWYATETEAGDTISNTASMLEAIKSEPAKNEALKVGDVIRIPCDGLECADVKTGDLLVVAEVVGSDITVHAAPGAGQDEWYFCLRNVERIDPSTVAVVDNVAYDLTAGYRDNDGDVWRFARLPNGDVRGNWHGSTINGFDSLLSDVVADCGPLVRI